MSERTISTMFDEDHERLDALFKSFQTLKRTDFPKAKSAFLEFKAGLQRHVAWEEEVMFPLWEKKSGMTGGGPTIVMRNEHREIWECLESLARKIQAQNPDSVQVGSGLERGDLVVTAGVQVLRPGQKVRLLETSKP